MPSKGTEELYTLLHTCLWLASHQGVVYFCHTHSSTMGHCPKARGQVTINGTSTLVSQHKPLIDLDDFPETISQSIAQANPKRTIVLNAS